MDIRQSSDVAAIAEDIVNHGFSVVQRDAVPRRSYDALYTLGEEFFRWPPEQKVSCAIPQQANTGYTPVGVEYSTSPEIPDQKESITYVPAETSLADAQPQFVQRLYDAMRRCVDVVDPLSRAVMLALAHRFGSNDPIYSHHYSQLALNCYPVAASPREVLIESHEDGCLLTILSSTAPGLELQLRSGGYAACAEVVEHFVIIAGRTLTLATSGRIPPTFHRVVRAPGVSVRYTIAWDITADLMRPIKPWSNPDSDVRIDVEARMTLTRFGLAPLGQPKR